MARLSGAICKVILTDYGKKCLGPRKLQSLTIVSEVTHGSAFRFSDPARFSFVHAGKDGSPFPAPIFRYDETISTLETAIQNAKLDLSDKRKAIKSLTTISQ